MEKLIDDNVKKQLLDELSKEPTIVLSTAYAYAKNYVDYGEDITKAWTTAVQQESVLQKVRQKAWIVAYNDFKADYENDIKTDNNINWIKCSSHLPDFDVDVLATTKAHGDVVKVTRWRNILKDCGWEWVLVDHIEGYAYNPDEIIAWMPLPKAYKAESGK